MNEWMNEWMNACMHECMDAGMNAWTYGRMDGWMDGERRLRAWFRWEVKGKNERIKNKNVHEAGDPSLPPKKNNVRDKPRNIKSLLRIPAALCSRSVVQSYKDIRTNSFKLKQLIPAWARPDDTALRTRPALWPVCCNSWWFSWPPRSAVSQDTFETVPLALEFADTFVAPRLFCLLWEVGPRPLEDRSGVADKSFESFRCLGQSAGECARISLELSHASFQDQV